MCILCKKNFLIWSCGVVELSKYLCIEHHNTTCTSKYSKYLQKHHIHFAVFRVALHYGRRSREAVGVRARNLLRVQRNVLKISIKYR